MDLQEVRGKINKLDESLNELFKERLSCTEKVAEVKLNTGDEVFKPEREKEIYSRYSDDVTGRNQKSFVKKIVQLSRKQQYRYFIENEKVDDDFMELLKEKGISFCSDKGGSIKLCLPYDEKGEESLCLKDILAIASDTFLNICNVCTDSKEHMVYICYDIDSSKVSCEEAFLMAYMLYKETGSL